MPGDHPAKAGCYKTVGTVLRIGSCFCTGMKPLSPGYPRGSDYIGFGYYSLTWVCYQRQTLFTQPDTVNLVWSQFLRASAETEVVTVAYTFMPDHVHQLVKGISLTADAKRYIAKAKQYSGYYFSKQFGVKLWQKDGHDRILLEDREPRDIVKYIIENPVRAGLVQRVEDYPYTGSAIHSIAELMEWAYTV